MLEGECPRENTLGECGSLGNQVITDNTGDDGVTATSGEKTRLQTEVADLYKKIALATEVATTSRNAYKNDPKIKKIVRTMMTDVVDAEGKLDLINTNVEALSGAVVQKVVIDEIGNKISEVERIITTLGEYEDKLIEIIEENYLFGIKKLYVFAGVAALILIIVLVLLM